MTPQGRAYLTSGRVALLLFGFTYQSRFAVEAWAKPFRGEFEKNEQVTFYEIPMIGGMARMGKWFIDSGMRRGTPKGDYENVITVYRRTEPWKQRLGVKEEDFAYLVVFTRRATWPGVTPERSKKVRTKLSPHKSVNLFSDTDRTGSAVS